MYNEPNTTAIQHKENDMIIVMISMLVIGLISIYLLIREREWDVNAVTKELQAVIDMTVYERVTRKMNNQYRELNNYKV